MNIQSMLNQEAIDSLPLVKDAIDGANEFNSNQMYCYTIQECLNTSPAIVYKTDKELQSFQEDLLNIFIHKNWLTTQQRDSIEVREYYQQVKKLTLEAKYIIAVDFDGNYEGYTGANAISMYLNNEHDINVTCDNTAQKAFCDALN